jgi:hypothetical protein
MKKSQEEMGTEKQQEKFDSNQRKTGAVPFRNILRKNVIPG